MNFDQLLFKLLKIKLRLYLLITNSLNSLFIHFNPKVVFISLVNQLAL